MESTFSSQLLLIVYMLFLITTRGARGQMAPTDQTVLTGLVPTHRTTEVPILQTSTLQTSPLPTSTALAQDERIGRDQMSTEGSSGHQNFISTTEPQFIINNKTGYFDVVWPIKPNPMGYPMGERNVSETEDQIEFTEPNSGNDPSESYNSHPNHKHDHHSNDHDHSHHEHDHPPHERESETNHPHHEHDHPHPEHDHVTSYPHYEHNHESHPEKNHESHTHHEHENHPDYHEHDPKHEPETHEPEKDIVSFGYNVDHLVPKVKAPPTAQVVHQAPPSKNQYGFGVNNVPPPPPPPPWNPPAPPSGGVTAVNYQMKNPDTGQVQGYHYNVNHNEHAQKPKQHISMPPLPPSAPPYKPRHHHHHIHHDKDNAHHGHAHKEHSPDKHVHDHDNNHRNNGHAHKNNEHAHKNERPNNDYPNQEYDDDYEYNNQYHNVPLHDYDYDEPSTIKAPIKYQKSKTKERLVKVTPISFSAFINQLSPGFKFIKEYDIWHHHHHHHHVEDEDGDINQHSEDHRDADQRHREANHKYVDDHRHTDADHRHRVIDHRLKKKPSVHVSKTKVVPMDVDVYEINDPENKINDIDEIIEGDIVDGKIIGDGNYGDANEEDAEEEDEENFLDLPELPDLPDLLPSADHQDGASDESGASYENNDYESSDSYEKTYWSPLAGVQWTPIKYRYRREERGDTKLGVHDFGANNLVGKIKSGNRVKLSHDPSKRRQPHPSFGVSEPDYIDYLSIDDTFPELDAKIQTDAKIQSDAKIQTDASGGSEPPPGDQRITFTPFSPSATPSLAENHQACKLIPKVASPGGNQSNHPPQEGAKNSSDYDDESPLVGSVFHNTDLKANRLRSNFTEVTTDHTDYEPEVPDTEHERNYHNTNYKVMRFRNGPFNGSAVDSANQSADHTAIGSLISQSVPSLFKHSTDGAMIQSVDGSVIQTAGGADQDMNWRLETHPGLNTDVRAFIHSKTHAPDESLWDGGAKDDDDYEFSQTYDEIDRSKGRWSYLPRDPRFSEYKIPKRKIPKRKIPDQFSPKTLSPKIPEKYSKLISMNPRLDPPDVEYLPRGPSVIKNQKLIAVSKVIINPINKINHPKKFSKLLSIKSRKKFQDAKFFGANQNNVLNQDYKNDNRSRANEASAPTRVTIKPNKVRFDFEDGPLSFHYRNISNQPTRTRAPPIDWNDDYRKNNENAHFTGVTKEDGATSGVEYLNELKAKYFDQNRPHTPPSVIKIEPDQGITNMNEAPPDDRRINPFRAGGKKLPPSVVTRKPSMTSGVTSTVRPKIVTIDVQQNLFPGSIQDIKNSLEWEPPMQRPQRNRNRPKLKPSMRKKFPKSKLKQVGKYENLQKVQKRPFKKIVELPRTPKSIDIHLRSPTTKVPNSRRPKNENPKNRTTKEKISKEKSPKEKSLKEKSPKEVKVMKKGSSVEANHEQFDDNDHHKVSHKDSEEHHSDPAKYKPEELEEPSFESDKKKEPIPFQYNIEVRSRGPQGPIHYNSLDDGAKRKINLQEGRDKHIDKELEKSNYKKSEHMEEEHWHEKKWEKEDLNENYLNGKGIVSKFKSKNDKFKDENGKSESESFKPKNGKLRGKNSKFKSKNGENYDKEESKLINGPYVSKHEKKSNFRQKIPHYAQMVRNGATQKEIRDHFQIPSKGFRVDDRFEKWVHRDVDVR